jgi:hypothetical protein
MIRLRGGRRGQRSSRGTVGVPTTTADSSSPLPDDRKARPAVSNDDRAVLLFPQRTKPLRGGEDRDLAHQRSALAARSTGSDFAPSLVPTRGAVLSSGLLTWGARSAPSSTLKRPAPPRAPHSPIYSNYILNQKACLSRLRPPRLHPQGRRSLRWSCARGRPCGYNVLQRTKSLRGGEDRDLVYERSASGTRPTDSDSTPCSSPRAMPCDPPAWWRRRRARPPCALSRSSGAFASARPTGSEVRPRFATALRIQDPAESAFLNCRSPSSVGSRLRAHKTETCREIVGSLDRSPNVRIVASGIKSWRASARHTDARKQVRSRDKPSRQAKV